MKSKIREYFKAHRDEIRKKSLKLLSEMVAVRSVNCGKAQLSDHPYLKISGEESKVVDILKRYFDAAGIDYKVYEMIEGRGNIIATYGEGEKSLCIGCHLDVVPAGERAEWASDPWVMTEKDGKVYGRGVMDNKGQSVACVMAMELLKNAGVSLKGELVLAALAGEEFREKDEPDPGIAFVTSKGYLKPTFAIIPDIGGHMMKIDIAEKGRTVIKVKSHGKQAHGSTPELGINAIEKLAHFIAKVEKFELKHEHHPILKKPSVNLGIIRGGSAANNVANYAEAIYDIRYVPGQSAEGIVADMRSCTEGIKDGRFEFEILDNNPPHQVDPDNILVKTIQSNAREIIGREPEPFGMGGGTFAKPFNLAGILAVGFGPGDADDFHVANEALDIEEMLQFIELIACISCDLLGVN
ncbi:MAG TPA: ArgE/DapE family deacylase [bacterium]|nr:M20 family metallopeptidase [Myxococcales bacterium]HPW44934.1 ArgE/DapE family deacylase [bacterium]HQG13557.1 ArgE/DapE family deacylase [bacterium]HQH80009.1 ArgE/DapE family deacylase [bacterium]